MGLRLVETKQMLLLNLIFLVITQLVSGGKVPAIIVFGDSTVDAGNNNVVPTIMRSNFRPYGRDFYGGIPTGRFSNGKVATDFISEAFGLKPFVPAYLDPAYGIEDFATGVCFASAGTGFDVATSDVLGAIPMWREVEFFEEYIARLVSYQGQDKAMHTISNAVYIVSIGTNDFMENYFLTPRRSTVLTIDQFEDFIIGLAEAFFTEIYRLGARKISMTGLVPMGCLPLERARNFGRCVERYNDVARSFNWKMVGLLGRLNKELVGLRFRFTHVYDAFLSILQNPSIYGYEKVDVGCCGSGTYEMGFSCNEWNPMTCRDANKYVFWDAFHPSEKTSFILARHTLNTTLAEFL